VYLHMREMIAMRVAKISQEVLKQKQKLEKTSQKREQLKQQLKGKETFTQDEINQLVKHMAREQGLIE